MRNRDGERLGHSIGHGVGLQLLHVNRHNQHELFSDRLLNVDPYNHSELLGDDIRQRVWLSFILRHSNAVYNFKQQGNSFNEHQCVPHCNHKREPKHHRHAVRNR